MSCTGQSTIWRKWRTVGLLVSLMVYVGAGTNSWIIARRGRAGQLEKKKGSDLFSRWPSENKSDPFFSLFDGLHGLDEFGGRLLAITVEHAGLVEEEEGVSIPEKPAPWPRLMTMTFFALSAFRIGMP